MKNVPISGLSHFLAEMKKIGDNEYFRVDVTDLDNISRVVTMKKDEHYFPTIEYVQDDSELQGWKKIEHGNHAGRTNEEMESESC